MTQGARAYLDLLECLQAQEARSIMYCLADSPLCYLMRSGIHVNADEGLQFWVLSHNCSRMAASSQSAVYKYPELLISEGGQHLCYPSVLYLPRKHTLIIV